MSYVVFQPSFDGRVDHASARLADDVTMTTTNNCSQGLDLRSTARLRDGRGNSERPPAPHSSSYCSTRILPPVKMEIEERKDAKLPATMDVPGE